MVGKWKSKIKVKQNSPLHVAKSMEKEKNVAGRS